MSDSAELASFQEKVLKEVEWLKTMVGMKDDLRKGVPEVTGVIQKIIYGASLNLGQHALKNMRELKKIDELTPRARAFLKERATREMLCRTLREVETNLSKLSVRDVRRDAEEIAGAITHALFPAAGGRGLPLEPVAFALCAWMLARTGIDRYCAGMDETEPLSL